MLGVREGVGELNSMAKEDFTLEPSRMSRGRNLTNYKGGTGWN